MGNKRLLINIVSSIISFGVSLGVSFLLTPFIIKNVGKEAYGFVGLANNFISYAQLITLALNSVAARFITIKIHEKNIEEASKYFTTVVLSNLIISVLMSIPSIAVVIFMDKLINVPVNILMDIKILWLIVFFNFLINIVTSNFGIITYATNRLDLSSLRSIESNILRISILIFLFTAYEPNIWYIGVASLICTIFIFINDLHYKRKLLKNLKIKFSYFEVKILEELLKSGVWNVITKLGQIFIDGLDLLICNIFIGASAMGTLSIAKTIPSAITGLLITTSNVFSPQLTIYYANKDTRSLVEELEKSMKISGLFTNIVMSGVIVLGYSFYSLWVPNENIMLIQILSILTVQNVIITGAINSLFGIFSITNNLRLNSYVTLIMGLINTIIVFTLLKTTDLGVLVVAGVSTTLSIMKNLTFTPIYAAKCLNISPSIFYRIITRYIITTITIIIVTYMTTSTIEISSWIQLIYATIACIIIGLILNYLLLFNNSDRDFIKNKLKSKLKYKLVDN